MDKNHFPTTRTSIYLCLILLTCLPLSIWLCAGNQDTDEYDGMREIEELEFFQTRNPYTNTIPNDAFSEAFLSAKGDGSLPLTENALLPTWIERGPYSDVPGPAGNSRPGTNTVTSGRTLASWVDLNDVTRKTVFVGGVSGGIWKTTDITATFPNWTPVDDMMSNLSISSICQNPVNPQIMYCATGYPYGNPATVRGVGVFKSTNGGASWSLLNNTTAYTTNTKIVCDASGNVYLARMGGGLLRSTGGGGSWATITPTGLSAAVTDIEISSTGRLHFATGFRNTTTGGYRYTDNPATVTSATWTAPTSGLTYPTGTSVRCELACVGNTVYLAAANPATNNIETLFKSTDGGVNWTSNSLAAISGSLNSGQSWFCFGFAVDPSNVDNLILGGLNCVKSTDGGATWTKISEWAGSTGQYVHADILSINWFDNGNKLLVSTDGGVFYSANKGTNFADRNTNLRLKLFYSAALHPSVTNHILTGAQDNGTHLINGAGLSTSIEVTGGDGAFVAIDQSQPQYQFGAYVYNQFRRSTNGGTTWTGINYSNSAGVFINPWDYDQTNAKIYASYSAGQYTRWDNPRTGTTADFVNQTIPEFNGFAVSAVKVSPYTSNTVYFGTQGGRVVKVANANTATPTPTNLTGIGMPSGNIACVNTGTNDQNLILSYSNYDVGNIWVSTNGGTTWTNIDGDLPNMPVRWVMFKPYENTKAYIATEMGVYETSNINGASTIWERHTSMPIVRTQMLTYRASDNTLVAATHGRGMWSTSSLVVLPVSLTTFTGYERENTAILSWQTAHESNNNGFDVEKSYDGVNFKKINFVKGIGNSNKQVNYSYTDRTPLSDIQYYRLKQVDYNNKIQYSKVIAINAAKINNFDVTQMSNPFAQDLQIGFSCTPEQPLSIALVDLNGRIVFSATKQDALSTQASFLIPNSVSSGIYVARITVGNQQILRKVMKL
jgi:trimeric autotransporter adhesin